MTVPIVMSPADTEKTHLHAFAVVTRFVAYFDAQTTPAVVLTVSSVQQTSPIGGGEWLFCRLVGSLRRMHGRAVLHLVLQSLTAVYE